MRKVWFLILMVLISGVIRAQDAGVKRDSGIMFENDVSFSAILAKARAEKKAIFMDCYTTWCAPCKYMKQEVFTRKAVGEFFNAHFINVSVQMDRTPKDIWSTKEWYAVADSLGAKFGVTAYPTFLIFAPDGNVIDRFVGSFTASPFLKRATDALDPQKQYYTLLNRYIEHANDSAFLRNALVIALESFDYNNAAIIGEYYLGTVQDPFALQNIELLERVNSPSSSKLFQFFLAHASRIDEILGSKDFAIENNLCYKLMEDEVVHLFDDRDAVVDYQKLLLDLQKRFPLLAGRLPWWIDGCFKHYGDASIRATVFKEDVSNVNWKSVRRKMRHQFPGYDCAQLIARLKPAYYAYKKMWPQCDKFSVAFLNRYGEQIGPSGINDITWSYLFKYSTNDKILQIALEWSKRVVELSPNNYKYLDTYANLLYKTGDRERALKWEEKSVQRSGGSNKEVLSNFEKMKNGEKTWVNAEADHRKTSE